MALPETVETPFGTQPFDQAVRWHLPSMLRWLDYNRGADYMPGGDMVGSTLRIAADRLESLAAKVNELRGPDVLPASHDKPTTSITHTGIGL